MSNAINAMAERKRVMQPDAVQKQLRRAIQEAKRQGYSQEDIAKATGLSRASVVSANTRGVGDTTAHALIEWFKSKGMWRTPSPEPSAESMVEHLAQELRTLADVLTCTEIPGKLRARRYESFIKYQKECLDDILNEIIGRVH